MTAASPSSTGFDAPGSDHSGSGHSGSDHPGSGRAPGAMSTADLVESMMRRYGQHVPLEIIARTVHGVLHERAHPRDAAVPTALRRQVARRVRDAMYAVDPGLRPARSHRAEQIARALAGRPR